MCLSSSPADMLRAGELPALAVGPGGRLSLDTVDVHFGCRAELEQLNDLVDELRAQLAERTVRGSTRTFTPAELAATLAAWPVDPHAAEHLAELTAALRPPRRRRQSRAALRRAA